LKDGIKDGSLPNLLDKAVISHDINKDFDCDFTGVAHKRGRQSSLREDMDEYICQSKVVVFTRKNDLFKK
jgi:hypothetical protein